MKPYSVEDFLETAAFEDGVIFDVRTPAEFDQGHIPGAVNLPLFSNEERAIVGTTYKEEGRQPAIKAGLEMIGPRMRDLVDEVERRVGASSGPVWVHCWRGGMRSRSVAWLLDLYGFMPVTLEGGYKSFRRWVLARLEDVPDLIVLGGRTGSGKTEVLHQLADQGEPVLDLEGLANHRGSAFGALCLPAQPTQEQFEAYVAVRMDELARRGEPVWVEDESRLVGHRKVPDRLMEAMRAAPVIALEIPTETRVEHLVGIYGDASRDELAQSFERISKRLGGERTKAAIEALAGGDLREAARIALSYYDKTYDHGLSRRVEEHVHWVAADDVDAAVPLVLDVARRL